MKVGGSGQGCTKGPGKGLGRLDVHMVPVCGPPSGQQRIDARVPEDGLALSHSLLESGEEVLFAGLLSAKVDELPFAVLKLHLRNWNGPWALQKGGGGAKTDLG